MAIHKHAMTKEGAILAITRQQVKDLSGGTVSRRNSLKNISKTFLDNYSYLSDDVVKEMYEKAFNVKLEIVKPRK